MMIRIRVLPRRKEYRSTERRTDTKEKYCSEEVLLGVYFFQVLAWVSKKEERWQNPRPKTRKPNPNPREENGKKKRTGREKGKRIFPYPKTDASLRRRSLDFDR